MTKTKKVRSNTIFQLQLLPNPRDSWIKKQYHPIITAVMNKKGVLDVDTVKGCTEGMNAYPGTGCYGECYAKKIAKTYGKDFIKSIVRKLKGPKHKEDIIKTIMGFNVDWYRIGTNGDPSHDWKHTISIIKELQCTKKIPVIITKHWKVLTDKQIEELKSLSAVINTSLSGLDTDAEIKHRVRQLKRLRNAGIRSICRVITCNFGKSEWARACKYRQDFLLTLEPVIDNPLRASKTNPRVISGEILLTKREDSVGGGKWVSLHKQDIYLGKCENCHDQCGVTKEGI